MRILKSTEKELDIRDKHLHKEGTMTDDFEPLSCPMCGGELRYSEGTHDLCCVENTPELLNTETGRGRREAPVKGFHEPRARYGALEVGGEGTRAVEEACSCNNNGVRVKEDGEDTAELRSVNMSEGSGDLAETPCVFALSFTQSGNFGTLWSIRTVHGGTNYFALMRLIDKIEKRQRRGEPLAANVPNLPRKVERSKESKIAFRYKIELEDLYSIKYSSETVSKLAIYYGLTEPDIRHIQSVKLCED